MCHQYTDPENAGISCHAHKFQNSETLGQCSRCLINIPLGHLCGITPEGELVCYAEVKNAKLDTHRYGPAVLAMLAAYTHEAQCA